MTEMPAGNLVRILEILGDVRHVVVQLAKYPPVVRALPWEGEGDAIVAYDDVEKFGKSAGECALTAGRRDRGEFRARTEAAARTPRATGRGPATRTQFSARSERAARAQRLGRARAAPRFSRRARCAHPECAHVVCKQAPRTLLASDGSLSEGGGRAWFPQIHSLAQKLRE